METLQTFSQETLNTLEHAQLPGKLHFAPLMQTPTLRNILKSGSVGSLRIITEITAKDSGEMMDRVPKNPTQVVYFEEGLAKKGIAPNTEAPTKPIPRELLRTLPKIPGLRWSLGTPEQIISIVEQHLTTKTSILLSDYFTYTDGGPFQYNNDPLAKNRVFRYIGVGKTSKEGIHIITINQWKLPEDMGVFVLGFPGDDESEKVEPKPILDDFVRTLLENNANKGADPARRRRQTDER